MHLNKVEQTLLTIHFYNDFLLLLNNTFIKMLLEVQLYIFLYISLNLFLHIGITRLSVYHQEVQNTISIKEIKDLSQQHAARISV